MKGQLISLAVLWAVTVGVIVYWRQSVQAHRRRLNYLDVRVHVNGIRGKSTVTRLVAGVLREGGLVTVAKTTGSAARVIGPHGEETPIFRRGAATINEQIDIVERHVTPETEALVIECMAVRPLYQQYAQDHMVMSDITVITNVREDHQEEMGETLEEIADSMSTTIPRGGILITAEDREHLRERLRRNAEAKGATLIYADAAQITDEEMRGFDYLQFKSNVAIGIELAHLLGISRNAAVQGMWKSVPDVGVVRLRTYDIRGKKVMWVPMFAANDRESVILTYQTLTAQFPPEATVIGVLNNRQDRGRRAELFAHMVPEDLAPFLDEVITFGAYEETVAATMTQLGWPRERTHLMGETVNPSLDEILDTVAALIPGEHGVLVGMVNIHTEQAEKLMHHFHEADGGESFDEIDESRQPERMPASVQALRRHAARLPVRTA